MHICILVGTAIPIVCVRFASFDIVTGDQAFAGSVALMMLWLACLPTAAA
jgi:hypothetical protein